MTLSDDEQQMLDELEKQLFADDPKLARAFSTSQTDDSGSQKPSGGQLDSRRILLGGLGVVIGLGLLVFAVSIPAIWLGVIAFLLMLGAAVYAITGERTPSSPNSITPPPSATGRDAHPAGKGGGLMKRFEERWDRRSNDHP